MSTKILKATYHVGKGSAKHNDRTFDTLTNESIIYHDLKNGCYVLDMDTGNFKFVEEKKNTFSSIEKEYYQKTFKASLDAKNQRYIKSGHKERCKTMTEVLNSQKTKPDEIILQVGNKDNPYDNQENFVKMVKTLIKTMRRDYPNFQVLDIAIHIDEVSIHAHVRGVYVGKDKDGNLEPNMSGAFREMRIERPDLTKENSRTNNPKQTFTDAVRRKWQDIIEEIDKDISIDREVKTPGRSHIDHKIYNKKKQIEKLDKDIEIAKNEAKNLDYNLFNAMQEFIREKELQEEFEAYYEQFFEDMYDNQYEI